MANSENLAGHGFHERTAEEQREIARAGGVASGAARRRKKAARQAFSSVLASLPKLDKPTKKSLETLGIDMESVDIQMIIATAIAQKAMMGNVAAANFMMEMTGEDAYSKIQHERLAIEKKRLALEQRRLEMEEKRAAGIYEDEVLDDGFIDALNAVGSEVWSDGGDEPADPDPEGDSDPDD